MAKEKKFGSIKRFGARYGRRLKQRLAIIEKDMKKPQLCPYCHKIAVKRVAVGIWYCKRCKSKFTGKAYNVEKKLILEEPSEATEEVSE